MEQVQDRYGTSVGQAFLDMTLKMGFILSERLLGSSHQCNAFEVFRIVLSTKTPKLTLIGFFTIGLFVRLFDRSKVTQNKINFVKNCPGGV